ncbi:unnamed protein product [Eruca vesicaria subsp. sativa]|uniref:Uncharacterized protein n=1 Tax=Eruca vesicaria subsp. sativa TaxID=29727 RepID=A0ABC8IY07_ERUVS|nr:unnamed protein product [Eruca vesicaria subsp. sativa]
METSFEERAIAAPRPRLNLIRRVKKRSRSAMDTGRLTFAVEYVDVADNPLRLESPSSQFGLHNRMDNVIKKYDVALKRSRRLNVVKFLAIEKIMRERGRAFDEPAVAVKRRDGVVSRLQGERMRVDLLEKNLALAHEATEKALREKTMLEQENNRLQQEKALLVEEMAWEMARLKISQIHGLRRRE